MAVNKIDGVMLKQMFETAALNLERNRSIVDELNVFPVPDGDTGTNMSMTISNAIAELGKLDQITLFSVAKTASSGALIGARGNSGVILSQLLRGVTEGCKDVDVLDIEGAAMIFRKAADAAYKAVMKPTEGTILTVAREMAEFAMDHFSEYDTLEDFGKAVVAHGNEALAKTPELLPVLKEAGVVDSGGKGLMYIVEGAYMALTGQTFDDEVIQSISARERFVDDSGMRPEDITFGYCTEFIVKNAQNADENGLRDYLNTIGDCVLVIKDDDIIKVHVHTDHPGLAFEKGLSCGALTRMKIDNMREMFGLEQPEDPGVEVETKPQPVAEPVSEKVPYGFVAVSPGEGLSKLFKQLGITGIISGGQTMNPSTQDFLNEVAKINAADIYLFPNNSNIIMAANQAAAISEKRLHVIPTKSIPQCVSAMFVFNENQTADENKEAMLEAIANVKYGEVTYAVRDTQINGLQIHKDDIMGITAGEITTTGNDVADITCELIAKMVDEDSELISLYYGEDVTEEEAEALQEKLEDLYEDCDVEVTESGQPLYYYFVAVE